MASLPGDLPYLRSTELDLALAKADLVTRSCVGDRSGQGTTPLTTAAGHDLAPAYGPVVEHVETTGATNADAAAACDVVAIVVPWKGHDELVATLLLDGKTVISCVNPLGFDKRGPHGLVVGDGQSSAAESTASLHPGAAVVGAFHHVSAVSLWGPAPFLDHEDLLVCGDSAEARQDAIDLAEAVVGRPGIDAGALRLARQLEPLTAVLININKRYAVQSGIRIAGLDGH